MKKFDVVVGNPPFNQGKKSGKGIYDKFVLQSFEQSDNFVTLVLPSEWTVSDSYKKMRKVLFNQGLEKVTFHGKIFENVNRDICTIVCRKGFNSNLTIKTQEGEVLTGNFKDLGIIPKVSSALEMQIIYKILNYPHKIKFYQGKQETVRHHGEKEFTSEIQPHKTKDCIFPLMSRLKGGNNEIYYTKTKKDLNWNQNRVAFAYMPTEMTTIGFMQYIPKNTYQLSSSLCYYPVNNKTEADNFIAYMKSDFVRFCLLKFKTAPAWSQVIFNYIPLPELRNFDTYTFMHNKIGLTDQEIDYIKQHVK